VGRPLPVYPDQHRYRRAARICACCINVGLGRYSMPEWRYGISEMAQQRFADSARAGREFAPVIFTAV
jgi:hypothetical protein